MCCLEIGGRVRLCTWSNVRANAAAALDCCEVMWRFPKPFEICRRLRKSCCPFVLFSLDLWQSRNHRIPGVLPLYQCLHLAHPMHPPRSPSCGGTRFAVTRVKSRPVHAPARKRGRVAHGRRWLGGYNSELLGIQSGFRLLGDPPPLPPHTLLGASCRREFD